MDAVGGLLVELLTLIRARSGFGLVMLTRVDGDDWTVVATTENPYGVADGDTFRWSASICSRMVGRRGAEWLLDDVTADADATAAPVRALLDIASYAGSPVVAADGALVGTVCAIDPDPRAAGEFADLFEFAGHFGAHVLDQTAAMMRTARAAERALFRTAPTGAAVMAAEAWPALLDAESERTRWTGEVLTLGLARVGGSTSTRRPQLEHVVGMLSARMASDDAVAVIGSNRVGILCVGRDAADLQTLLAEIAVDIELASVVSEVRGVSASSVVELMETELVGAPAAAARSSSRLTYAFCGACGRKGVYRSAVADVTRCKFCGVVSR